MLTLALTGLAIFLAFIYWNRRNTYSHFRKLGIPGPIPNILWGNLDQISRYGLTDNPSKIWEIWTKEYGKIYGYYEGTLPIIVTSDLDFLKQVFVKQFSKFNGRKMFPIMPDSDRDDSVHMVEADGQRWKRLRTIATPTFSANKMKQMSPLINKAVNVLMDRLEEDVEKEATINIQSYFQGLSMDVIGSCAFGIEVDSQRNSNDEFLVACKEMFDSLGRFQLLFAIPVLFPSLRRLCYLLYEWWSRFALNGRGLLLRCIDQLVAFRRAENKQAQRRIDFLQLLLDAENSHLQQTNESVLTMSVDNDGKTQENGVIKNGNVTGTTAKSNGSAAIEQNGVVKSKPNGTANGIKLGLSTGEVKAQSLLFLLAGYETTSSALAYTAYELALNMDIQEKLHAELDECVSDDEELTYESVQKLSYLDKVFSEVLRMHPLAPFVVSRRCMESCVVEGVPIYKNTLVQPDLWTIHFDQEQWGNDPYKFDPERFEPSAKAARHSMAYLPFGAGPRNCIGMRFAFMEAKIALVRVLRKYTIERCSETQVPLEIKERGTLVPKDGVTVHLKQRSSHK